MSIFSNLRKSRQQAKEHTAKLAEQKKKEEDKVPYKHVPTHAAADAFASAPPSWREADRPRIIEQNRRRSAMAASGHHMNMPGPGGPRISSSLSRVSYPGEDVASSVRLPRAYSYNGVSPYLDRSREVVYSVPDVYCSQPPSLKGKDVARGAGCEPQRVSPTSSKGDTYPVDSSSGSTSSQDDLEMRSSRSAARLSAPAHRLHPSHRRRISDASASSSKATGLSGYPRDPRPPPSMRGFASINQLAAPLPTYPGSLHPVSPPQVNSSSQSHVNGSSTPVMQTSRQSSTSSLPGLAPVSTRPGASAPATPAVTSPSQSENSLSWVSIQNTDLDLPHSADAAGTQYPAAETRTFKERKPARTTRFTELDRIESPGAEPEYQDFDRADRSRAPPPLAHEHVVNVFPEPVSLPEPAASSSSKSKKLAKGGGKLLKKNRWSSSKSQPITA